MCLAAVCFCPQGLPDGIMMGHVWENLQEDSLHLPRTKRLQISRPDSSSFAQEESHNSETGFLPGAVAAPLGVALGLPPVGV